MRDLVKWLRELETKLPTSSDNWIEARELQLEAAERIEALEKLVEEAFYEGFAEGYDGGWIGGGGLTAWTRSDSAKQLAKLIYERGDKVSQGIE